MGNRQDPKARLVLVVCAHVTWLNFARHRPGAVIYEVAKKLARSAARLGVQLSPPAEIDYQEDYSLRFNDLVDQLILRLPGARLALLIDEFDKAYSQATDPRLGYDDTFFNYLRGLSLMDGISVVLAGGEDLPEFVRELGPTFNNARRIRVSYLDDDSVRKLIRNKYVEWLDIPDPVVDAVAQMTHGNPFFTQLICTDLYDVACDQRSLQLSTRDVEEVARQLVSDRLTTEQMAHLYLQEGAGKRIAPALLYLLSQGATLSETPAQHANELAARVRAEPGAVRHALNALLEREVLQHVPEQPGHVRVVMPLFAAWFVRHCPLQTDAWKLLEEASPP